MNKILNSLGVLVTITLAACSDSNSNFADTKVLSEQPVALAEINPRPLPNPDKNAYFGDLHVHTENSFDAYTFGTIATPADAYKYAQGHAILHPSGFLIQLGRPLDFYAVTDHGV
ncbi:MAG: DUF3604 domain-containing protein, partial [Gammaproteobacteria bacterium]